MQKTPGERPFLERFYAPPWHQLDQLLPVEVESPAESLARWAVPAVHIVDAPRFGWRGFMLDVSRTFFSVDYLLRTIDLLSLYKMNVFHLHLSDDQGWRVDWLYYLEHDLSLESLWGEPEFQAMLAEIKADMASQLERVREMERNGELEPIQEVVTAQ